MPNIYHYNKEIFMRTKKEEITEPYDKPNTLMLKLIEAIEEDKRTYLELYRDTGVPFYWIRNLANGKFINPSVNRCQYLYERMTGKKLFDA